MMLSYMRIFQRMGLRAIPMVADTGPIGGDLSHEFIILAPTGESQVYFDAAFETLDFSRDAYNAENEDDLARCFTDLTTHYAATDEKHDEAAWANVENKREGRGIEVGHIFYFGTKYSEPMGLTVAGRDGAKIIPHMGSYGVGVSRLVGAVIEASHDDKGIIWPDSIAPFKAVIINLKTGDAVCDALCEQAYAALKGEALYDDRDERAGAKFNDADLMGHPWQIVIGPRGAATGTVELKRRATGEKLELSLADALTKIG